MLCNHRHCFDIVLFVILFKEFYFLLFCIILLENVDYNSNFVFFISVLHTLTETKY